MKDLAIYGAGGLGREIAVLIDQINARKKRFRVVGYFDDGRSKGTDVDGLKVLGGLAELNRWKKPLEVVIAIADPATRARVAAGVSNSKTTFPTLVHPSANLGAVKKNMLGKGSIVTAGVIMTTQVKLGEFVIINLATTIGHDVRIGDFSSVMPSCSISGNVTIGEQCFVGTGARILQNLSLGNRCIVGAGAVVTRSFEAGCTVMGVPAVKM